MFEIKPKTRKEIYMAYLAGDMSLELPEPLTRDEVTLYNLCQSHAYGSTTTVKEVLAECQPLYTPPDTSLGDGSSSANFKILAPVEVVAGEKYIVNWNGVEYQSTAINPGSDELYVGNLAVAGMEDTGEPYVLQIYAEPVLSMDNNLGTVYIYGEAIPFDGSTTLTISIRQEVTTVQKMSGKYVEGMGWSEGGGENLVKGVLDPEGYESNSSLFYLNIPKLNMFKSYDITIRGDVYKSVAPQKINPYYTMLVWGSYYGDNADYPFGMTAVYLDSSMETWGTEWCPWDTEGNWVGYDEPYAQHVEYWAEPQIMIDTEKYPDLTIDEIKICEVETIHPIDLKFLPSGGGAFYVNFEYGEELGDGKTACTADKTFAEILEAYKKGMSVYCRNIFEVEEGTSDYMYPLAAINYGAVESANNYADFRFMCCLPDMISQEQLLIRETGEVEYLYYEYSINAGNLN